MSIPRHRIEPRRGFLPLLLAACGLFACGLGGCGDEDTVASPGGAAAAYEVVVDRKSVV